MWRCLLSLAKSTPWVISGSCHGRGLDSQRQVPAQSAAYGQDERAGLVVELARWG